MITKTCAYCGKEFSRPKEPHQRFCSPTCRNKSRTKITVKLCLTCGKEFKPHNINALYCSRQCSSVNQRGKQLKPRTPKYCKNCGAVFFDSKHIDRKYCSHSCAVKSSKKLVIRICPGCHVEFTTKPSSSQLYCSAICAYSHRGAARAVPEKKAIFTCVVCGKEFEGWVYRNPRCCSRKCASVLGVKKLPSLQLRRSERVTLVCEVCGNEYKLLKSYYKLRGSRFCSAHCRSEWLSIARQGAGNHNYRGGTVTYRGRNWGKQSRLALKRDGYKCQICGKKLGRKGWDYGVYHIKPYREFNGDYISANKLPNLITLCRSCHTRVEAGKLPCPRPLF